MIDKATFEAHVRAEAERRWPMPDDEPDHTSMDRQSTYIAARMEHEWTLVEFTTKLLDYWQAGNFSRHPFQMELQDILTPYTTKPIEP